MKAVKRRLEKLEKIARQLDYIDIESMTDDQLVAIATGGRVQRYVDLSDADWADLETMAAGVPRDALKRC